MSAVEAILEEGVELMKARTAPLPPLSVLAELGQLYPDETVANAKAFSLIWGQCAGSLTAWWLKCKRTHAEVLKLFQDALWDVQTGGGE